MTCLIMISIAKLIIVVMNVLVWIFYVIIIVVVLKEMTNDFVQIQQLKIDVFRCFRFRAELMMIKVVFHLCTKTKIFELIWKNSYSIIKDIQEFGESSILCLMDQFIRTYKNYQQSHQVYL